MRERPNPALDLAGHRDWWLARRVAVLGACAAALLPGIGLASDTTAQGPVCCDGMPAYPHAHNTDGLAGAGGRAIAYRAGGTVVRSARIRAQAPTPHLFVTPYGGWEPTIGITDHGTIFYAARNSNFDPLPLRSRDGGRTWQAVPPSAPFGTTHLRTDQSSLDPYLFVDRQTGRVFDSDIPPTVSCTQSSFTDNQGASWTTSFVCGQVDHQSVFAGPPPSGAPKPSGYRHVVYFCAINGGEGAGTSTATTCEKSLDGGVTFNLTGQAAYPPRATPGGPVPNCDGGAGHGIADSRGAIYLPRTWCGPPYLAISHDEGATWTRVRLPGRSQAFDTADGAWPHEAGVTVDGRGNIYYDWVAGNGHPYLAVSRDGGRHWSTPLDILPPRVNRMSEFTSSIDVAAPGHIAAVYYGTPASRRARPERTTWNAYVVESYNALSRHPVFFAASINNPRTNPLWRDGGGRESCGPVRCGNTGDFMDIKFAPDGTPWAALVDSCPGPENRCTEFTTTTPRGQAIVGHLVPPRRSPRSGQHHHRPHRRDSRLGFTG